MSWINAIFVSIETLCKSSFSVFVSIKKIDQRKTIFSQWKNSIKNKAYFLKVFFSLIFSWKTLSLSLSLSLSILISSHSLHYDSPFIIYKDYKGAFGKRVLHFSHLCFQPFFFCFFFWTSAWCTIHEHEQCNHVY